MSSPHTTNSDGASNQALAVVPSSSNGNKQSCDALAPAPLSLFRDGRASREPDVPASPEIDELTRRFSEMEHSVKILREEITAQIFALAEALALAPDPALAQDLFCTGCCAIQKQLGPLNSTLLRLQLAIRMGTPL